MKKVMHQECFRKNFYSNTTSTKGDEEKTNSMATLRNYDNMFSVSAALARGEKTRRRYNEK